MDPIMHDAEALARALDARAALGAAAAEGLSPELREALAAAEGLERWRDPLAGGPRPSFVQSLEDQLRADLRTGIGRAARREASPWAGRTLLAGALLLALGLLLGRVLPGGHLADRLPAAAPAGLAPASDTATDGRAAAVLSDATGFQPHGAADPRHLPLLTAYPPQPGSGLDSGFDLAGPPPALPARVAERDAAPPDRSGDSLPAAGAPVAAAQAQAPAPAAQGAAPQPQPEAPPEAPDEDPEEAPAAAPAAPTEAPAPPPERTPDADPEP